jgi:hypothetical protein
MSEASHGIVLSPELAQIASRYTANPSEVVPAEVREEYLDVLAFAEIARMRDVAKREGGRRWFGLRLGFASRSRAIAASRGATERPCPAGRSAAP